MKKILDSLVSKIQGPLSKFAAKLGSIKLVQAMAETFQILMPVLVVGAFGCLFYCIDFEPWQNFLAKVPVLINAGAKIHMLSLFIFGLFVLIMFPSRYAEKLGMEDTVTVTPVAVLTFLVLTPVEMWTSIPVTWIGQQGIFSVMVISVIVVRVVKLLQDKNVTIKMPESVPVFVKKGFAAVVPCAIIVPIAAILGAYLETTSLNCVHNIIFSLIQKPLSVVGVSWYGHIISNVVCAILFFFGIQPGAITSIFEPLLIAGGLENLAAYAAGEPIPNLYVGGYTNLVSTGSGIYLVLALLIFAKQERYKKVAKFSLIPSIFGISEPVVFGAPIVLNAYLLIPYLLTPVVNGILSAIVINAGLIGPYTGTTVTFIVPVILNQLLTSTTPVAAAIWQVIQIGIDVCLWAPFVILMDREEKRRIESEQSAE